MPSYLLLRNNTKSGPYSLDDLVKFGLKPYDLVWVEGKSAAWRYPSEVAELKPYAPGVEEQPYDRFFKKNTSEKKEETATAILEEKPAVNTVKEKQIQEAIALEEKYKKYIPKKSVFVTLPGQKAAVAVQKPAVTTPPPQPVVQPKVQVEEEAAPVISVTENPAAQVKYSQPLDEIKEMYVKTLQQRKTRIARRSVVVANLKKASVVVGLIAIGLLAGLIIKPGKEGKKELAQQPVQQAAQPVAALLKNEATPQEQVQLPQSNQADLSLADQALATQNNLGKEGVAIDRTIPVSPEVNQQLSQQQKQVKTRRETVLTEKDPAETFDNSLAAGSDPVTGERKRIMRGEDNTGLVKATMKPVKPAGKTSLDKQVSVVSNDYKRVAFGGIRNLELTVVNSSKFILDKVTVELQYLKPNEEPLKTEMIQFHAVSPNGSMTMRVKDTNRGIKVQYKIIDIQTSTPETAMSGF